MEEQAVTLHATYSYHSESLIHLITSGIAVSCMRVTFVLASLGMTIECDLDDFSYQA